MTLSFIQLATFVADWRRLRLIDEDLRSLELTLMGNPNAGAVMRGTGGLRKLRFAPPSWATGKSGATRVCYAYFATYQMVFLVTIFGKNEKANLTKAEQNVIATALKRIGDSLAKGSR